MQQNHQPVKRELKDSRDHVTIYNPVLYPIYITSENLDITVVGALKGKEDNEGVSKVGVEMKA